MAGAPENSNFSPPPQIFGDLIPPIPVSEKGLFGGSCRKKRRNWHFEYHNTAQFLKNMTLYDPFDELFDAQSTGQEVS